MLQSARIVIPDDAPPVVAPSEAYRKFLERVQVDYHDTFREQKGIDGSPLRLAIGIPIWHCRSRTCWSA